MSDEDELIACTPVPSPNVLPTPPVSPPPEFSRRATRERRPNSNFNDYILF